MNDYFDQFERSMGTALEGGAHVRWYSRRLARIRHGRTLAVVFAALVIGGPAGAVSDCFGACVPVHAVRASIPVSRGGTLAADQPLRPGAGSSIALVHERLTAPPRDRMGR